MDDLKSILAHPSERAAASGGGLKLELHTLPVVPVQRLARKVEHSGNTRMRNRLSEKHLIEMVEAYIEGHDVEEAIFNGDLGYRYDQDPVIANNLGYLFLASDNLQSAREFLEKAARDHEEPERKALPNYNLGVVEAKEGKFEDALAKFKLAMEQIEPAKRAARKCLCLFLPYIAEEQQILEFRELRDPDILETAQSAASAIKHVLGQE